MKTEDIRQKGAPNPAPSSAGSLEIEKIQIERERLALERERWSAEREKFNANRELADHATGRVTISISTLALIILCALLAGGGMGFWLTRQNQPSTATMRASLLQALGTNRLDGVESDPFHHLGRQRRGGYLLILD